MRRLPVANYARALENRSPLVYIVDDWRVRNPQQDSDSVLLQRLLYHGRNV